MKPNTDSPHEVEPLTKDGFIPLYYQIQRALMERIHSGSLSEGDPIDSEEELARIYRVSRMTARQALNGLKTTGYAFSERGRGTFVARPKLEKNIMHLHGFTEDMKQRGMVPSSRLLEQSVAKASVEIALQLQIPTGENVMRLRRLRLADKIPMAIEDSYLPLKSFPLLQRINFTRRSLYQVLREEYDITVAWADEIIEALPATAEEAKLLTIPLRSSVLSISRVIVTTDQKPIESACSRYRGDRYRASIRVPATSIE